MRTEHQCTICGTVRIDQWDETGMTKSGLPFYRLVFRTYKYPQDEPEVGNGYCRENGHHDFRQVIG